MITLRSVSNSFRPNDSSGSQPFDQIVADLGRSPDRAFDLWESDERAVVLRFYGDDSFGRNEPGFQGCCAVAGFMTNGRYWKKVSADWRAALSAAPKIDYFRMREYAAENFDEKGQFQGLTTTEADAKFDALLQVIEHHGPQLAWVESIITWDAFHHATQGLGQLLYKDPHYFGITGIVNGCRETIRSAISQDLPVMFVFDEQEGMDEFIHWSWKLNKRLSPREQTVVMGSICFANDKDHPALQCADLLAWHVRRQYIQLAEDHGRSLPAYRRLRDAVPKRASAIWNEEKMRETYAAIARQIEAFGRERLRVDEP